MKWQVQIERTLGALGAVCLVLFVVAGGVEGWQADAELRSARWTVPMWGFLTASALLFGCSLVLWLRRKGR